MSLDDKKSSPVRPSVSRKLGESPRPPKPPKKPDAPTEKNVSDKDAMPDLDSFNFMKW